MKISVRAKGINRRDFLKRIITGVCLSAIYPFKRFAKAADTISNDIFWVENIPNNPFFDNLNRNHHAGIESLLQLMGAEGLKFYRSSQETDLSGPLGLIESNDVVLIKVNAQWKYRGCTNSDLIRGLIQGVLDHPDGFNGEVVIIENGQGRGSLNCDTSTSYGGDTAVHANANNESHSFLYLVNTVFNDSRVSAYLLDPIRNTFIGENDHTDPGYRIYENVSYPCFTSAGGHRIELREGIWNGSGYSQNLKLINVPVLKHHDVGGSEITESLKHMYGILSMVDGQVGFRHYAGLGETCGKMMVSVRTPVLNIIDAIWVSHSSITGYPASTTFRANQIMASQDPVALDYVAAKYLLYSIDNNDRHHPDFPGIDTWLTAARDIINERGGLYNIDSGILIEQVTKTESEMRFHLGDASPYNVFGVHDFDGDGVPDILWRNPSTGANALWYMQNNGTSIKSAAGMPYCELAWQVAGVADFDGDGVPDILWRNPSTGANALWYMQSNGTAIKSAVGVPYCEPAWQVAGVADFDGDGVPDILWRNPSTGANALWYMDSDGTAIKSAVGVPSCSTSWQIAGLADFDGDGVPDILWRNPSTGANALWYMQFDGTAIKSAAGVPSCGTSWEVGKVVDFDGDGVPDILWRNPSTGANALWYMQSNGTAIKCAAGMPSCGTAWDIGG